MTADYDLLVIGGGINGAGIARDAAGRGARTLLVEMGDLAGATSSASTKLIHGGLRYLEYYEFSLVRKALKEREVLWGIAPHIAWPLRFVLPHHEGLRPAWLLRLGLFLYDHLGGRKLLPATRTVRLDEGALAQGLAPGVRFGFEYSDCWVDDARLVVLNTLDASDRGAEIRTRVKCEAAVRKDGVWQVSLVDQITGARSRVTARALVNAAGPWVAEMLGTVDGNTSTRGIRLVKGSHIVVPRLFDHDRCFIFQNADGRIVFAIPYERDFTLVGTTDVDHDEDPAGVAISEEEIGYLCQSISEYLEQPVSPEDVVHTFSGVRPLVDDGAEDAKAATRDYLLDLEDADGALPVISVFGGKITTYRRLSEQVIEKLKPYLSLKEGSWTGEAPLPGGNFKPLDIGRVTAKLAEDYPFLTEDQLNRFIHAYGTDAWTMLGAAANDADLGPSFGAGLTTHEVNWLMDRELARTEDDVLWRRSKLGLRLDAAGVTALKTYMEERLARLREQAA